MAEILFPSGFLENVSALENEIPVILDGALEAGGEIMLEAVKGKLSAVIGKVNDPKSNPSRSTGELVNALGTSPVKVNFNGDYNIKVGFSESRPDGEVNAKIANVIEYGKEGQPPRPFLKPAKSSNSKRAKNAIKEYIAREIDKI